MAFNAMVEFGTRDAAVNDQLLEHYARVAAIVTQALERWQQTDVITRTVPAAELAHTLLSTLIGVVTIASVERYFTYRDAITRLMLTILQPQR